MIPKEKVDYAAIDKLVEYLINVQKIDGFYVTGSTGEFLTLSLQEKEKILERVAKATKKELS
ncbi:N-acetylneuraminate lyase [Chlamydia trachomatis]|uniref:Sialic acid lyase n=1 Tax=Mesomycoplasma hyorhinis SK76 TaxID=1118964 RepID=A0AAI8AND6_MESHY|nr:dihydrodipicolinate synthase family protein [Mesomycoplasma hyorhinis]AFX74569.1 sialic acid lyase [Mesomycoplasma hyorhinis SK76]AHA41376.1 dihydrodipicolinate synthetase family protein [Mesomycoplasma hyorhinis DBS 1050]CRH25049.1 N-acetylneuraminate lyase [Chlamydia trachomatis]AOD25603.1 sialic acid lyase [Mesomycoplasma hyorhinis]QEA01950.1 sialic acid lyase [Mesomycoplasma hyorhinis]